MDDPVRALSEALGHEFLDPRLLELALTHSSAAFEAAPARKGKPEGDNERMEFLGDAVMSLVVSDALWKRFPDAPEGELTRMRAAIVNEASLAEVASRAGVGEALRLGRGEERTGGRKKPSLMANCLEAIFAAVYLDAGIDRAREVLLALLAPAIERATTAPEAPRDEKTILQERSQAEFSVTPRYAEVGREGPDHDRVWRFEVRVGEVVSAQGSGRSRKLAEQEAARNALRTLDEPKPPAGGDDPCSSG